MRPSADAPPIPAPPFPGKLPWINVAPLRMDKQKGRPVLVEFWDFCRVNSLRTLPYLRAWHERYAGDGLRVIGIHTGGFACSRETERVREWVELLGIEYPVVVDERLELWDFYGNEGWPARYLWTPDLALHSIHYGEGAYAETEAEIQALLGISNRPPLPPLRPEDAPEALIVAPTPDVAGPFDGAYAAGGVWAVCDGPGTLLVDGRPRAIERCGCHPVVEHAEHTEGELTLKGADGLSVLATCFVPGLAPAD